MLALGFTGSVRTQVDLVETEKGRLESEMLADGAVHLGILALMQANGVRALSADSGSAAKTPEGPIALVDDATGHWGWSSEVPLRVDATPYVWRDSAGEVTIHFEAESGKLDLNAVSGELLLRQLEVLGASPDEAKNIAEAFELYRSKLSEQIARAQGPGRAEPDSDTRRPFTSIDQFRHVGGVTRAVFALVEPYLTVYSGRASPDPAVASVPVLAALENAPRGSMSGVTPIMSAFGVLATNESALSAFPVASEGSARSIYTIRADVTTDQGYRFVRKAAVELVDGGPLTYRIHRWAQSNSRTQRSVR